MTAPLALWHDGPTRTALLSFVDAVTTPGSPDFVPPARRVATFDNDGTLWCEQPAYVQLLFALERAGLSTDDVAGLAAEGERGVARLVADTHTGMTVEEFATEVREWIDHAVHPSLGRRFLDCTYAPMVELLGYLSDHDFKVFIISGGGIEFLRVFAEDVYGVPPEQVMGSSVATEYRLIDGVPSLFRLGEIAFVNDKAGKPVGIHHRTGRRPILAFGNSDGDFEMLEYTAAGDGARLCLLLHHDDAEREFAYDRGAPIGELARGLDEAADRGWIVVSMRDDFRQVFA